MGDERREGLHPIPRSLPGLSSLAGTGLVSRGRTAKRVRDHTRATEKEKERERESIGGLYDASRCGFCVCRVIGYYRLFLLGYIPRGSPREIESSSPSPPPFVSSFCGAWLRAPSSPRCCARFTARDRGEGRGPSGPYL